MKIFGQRAWAGGAARRCRGERPQGGRRAKREAESTSAASSQGMVAYRVSNCNCNLSCAVSWTTVLRYSTYGLDQSSDRDYRSRSNILDLSASFVQRQIGKFLNYVFIASRAALYTSRA